MKIRELRTELRGLEKSELMEILVEMYKTLPKVFIEEEAIDDLITNRIGHLEARQREKEEAKRMRQADRAENVTPIAAIQKWKTVPQYAREMLLNNVWCSNCGEIRGLKEYSVESAGQDIVLRGVCPVCHQAVARYVEIS